ncbi:MAG: hypothetical protein DSY60_02210 [Persephonella sp.]|nr:MAG: hypothetical protein DSY60_02210 [Persephonella sp.]
MGKYAIPKDLKIELIKNDLTLKDWCNKYGFNLTLAQKILNKRIKDITKSPKSKQIILQLKRDFPEFYEKFLKPTYSIEVR